MVVDHLSCGGYSASWGCSSKLMALPSSNKATPKSLQPSMAHTTYESVLYAPIFSDLISRVGCCVQLSRKSQALHDKAVINCQFSMATFSTSERKRKPKGDR